MRVSFWLPRIPAGLVTNLLGLLGMAGVAYFVGALLGNFLWSGLIGSVFAFGLALANAPREEPAADDDSGALTGPTRKLSTVKPAKTA